MRLDVEHFVHSMETYALIAGGGVVGASMRWGVSELVQTDSFPWATLVVNVAGAALLAVVLNAGLALTAAVALAVGVCGGLTTFSTMAVEVVELADSGRTTTAAIYVIVSLATGLGAYMASRRITIDRMRPSERTT